MHDDPISLIYENQLCTEAFPTFSVGKNNPLMNKPNNPVPQLNAGSNNVGNGNSQNPQLQRGTAPTSQQKILMVRRDRSGQTVVPADKVQAILAQNKGSGQDWMLSKTGDGWIPADDQEVQYRSQNGWLPLSNKDVKFK